MNGYTKLALSYRQWHYRVTVAGLGSHRSPQESFCVLPMFNALSLMLLGPIHWMPGWLFASLLGLAGAVGYRTSRSIYKANPIEPHFAKLTDAVPPWRDFPGLYTYMLGTLAFFVLSISYVIWRSPG